MHYQGHLNDGSSIQAHSAGGLYPYVIYAQGNDVLTYGVIAPGQSGYLVGSYGAAVAHAAALKEGTGARTNGQCFAVGQTVRVTGLGINGEQANIREIRSDCHQALVLPTRGRLARWVPLHACTLTV